MVKNMAERKELVVSSEYHVVVKYGRERLEDCIEKMLQDKEKNIKIINCNSENHSV